MNRKFYVPFVSINGVRRSMAILSGVPVRGMPFILLLFLSGSFRSFTGATCRNVDRCVIAYESTI